MSILFKSSSSVPPKRGGKIGLLVQKSDQLKHPHDNDTSKTKRTKSATASSASLPLRAWPSRGGHYAVVPEVLGLDKYAFDVGVRLAARAETKFSQQLAEDIPRQRARQVPGGAAHEALSDSVGQSQEESAKECFVEAGRKGSAAILWNRSSQSTDRSQAQLRKRREKMTDDMLKEIVMSYSEPFKVVSSWFAVFDFYCDRPVDVTMPPIPEPPADIDSETPPSSGNVNQHISPCSSNARPRLRSGSCPLSRSNSARKLLRPRLRHATGQMQASGSALNEELWQRRDKELGKFKFPPSAMGELNMEKRCKAEYLDSDKLGSWVKGYENMSEMGYLQRRAAINLKTTHTELVGHTQTDSQVAKLKQCVFTTDLLSGFTQSCRRSQLKPADVLSENSDDDNTASSNVSEGWVDSEPVGAREVMLRVVSKSLLKSKLLQKEKAEQHEKAQQTISEVTAERSRILKSISPVQMTSDNLFRTLALYGLARRKNGVKIYDCLVHSFSKVAQSKSIGVTSTSVDADAPQFCFAAYYQLMQSLLGGKLKSTHSSSRPASGKSGSHVRANPWETTMHINEVAWSSSELMRRLMFSLVSGRSACRAENAARRRVEDDVAVPLSTAVLGDSLRLFLSAPVLVEVDRGSITAGSENVSSSTSVADRHGAQMDDEGTESSLSTSAFSSKVSNIDRLTLFGFIVECLHEELMKSQAETSRPDECVDTVPLSVLSFRGFEHFVVTAPGTYSALWRLLFPLLPHGVALTSEEIDLSARGLSQRCGELRARIEMRVQVVQRKLMMRLHADFTKPQHDLSQ